MELPPELFLMVIEHLDTQSYVERHLEDDPEEFFDLKGTPCGPDARKDLKNASLVCHAWHAIIRPLLFRHVHLCHYFGGQEHMNFDERKHENDAQAFFEREESFLMSVMQSLTISVLPPLLFKLVRENMKGLAKYRGMCVSEVAEALEPVDYVGHQVLQRLTRLSGDGKWLMLQRITILGTGAAMEVYLRDRARFRLRHSLINSPRLQILSASRRQRERCNPFAFDHNMPHLHRILHAVDADDLVINEGSLFEHGFGGQDYANSMAPELDLGCVITTSLEGSSPQTRHLKSFTYISLFNYERGLTPVSFQLFGGRPNLLSSPERASVVPDIYHHRILPRNFTMSAFLTSLASCDIDIEQSYLEEFEELYEEKFVLPRYTTFWQHDWKWACAYRFDDIASREGFPVWEHLATEMLAFPNFRLPDTEVGWIVDKECWTSRRWIDSVDEDKREVRELDIAWT